MSSGTIEMSDAFTESPDIHLLYHDDIEQTICETGTGNGKFALPSKKRRVNDGYL